MTKLASLSVDLLPFEGFLISWILEVNLDKNNYLKYLLLVLAISISQPESYKAEINFQAISPMPLRSSILLALL